MTDEYEEAIAQGRPYSESRGAAQIGDDWLLTHVIWHPTGPWGEYLSDCHETGVRFLRDIKADGRPRFELIQHGWRNFTAAQRIIERGLRKGWDADRIATLMDFIKSRRRGI